MRATRILVFFFFNDTATTEIYTLSLHDALPILPFFTVIWTWTGPHRVSTDSRSEEHTSELQSQFHLVCRLLLEKKKRFIISNSVSNMAWDMKIPLRRIFNNSPGHTLILDLLPGY